MEKITLDGSIVGVSERTSKRTGNKYKIITVVLGGDPMGLILNKDEGVDPDFKGEVRRQKITVGLSGYDNRPQLDFLSAA